MKKNSSGFGLLKFFFSITIGAIYGVLFARKSGKELRKEIRDSDTPVLTFFKELVSVDTGMLKEMTQWAKESEMLQDVMQKGTDQFDALVKQAKTLGTDASDRAREELEKLADNARGAAESLAKDAKKQVKTVKKDAVKKVKKVKKDAVKKVSKAKKTATKKVVAAKKTATKKAKAVKKVADKKLKEAEKKLVAKKK